MPDVGVYLLNHSIELVTRGFLPQQIILDAAGRGSVINALTGDIISGQNQLYGNATTQASGLKVRVPTTGF
jgi:hypothetical protein